MSRKHETWDLGRQTVMVDPAVGLVRLGDWTVPSRVHMSIRGSKAGPRGRRWPSVYLTFEVRDGAAVCSEFRVASGPGDRPLRSSDLLVFDLDRLAETALTTAGRRRGQDGQSPADHVALSAEGFVSSARDLNRAVHGLTEASYRDPVAELREVARVYLDPLARRRPTDSVMEVLGYGSRATASRKVKRARELGLIPAVGADESAVHAARRALGEADDE